MKTWEEMSEHEQLSCIHYDAYKDCYGFRPRHIDYNTKSVEDIKADIDAIRWNHSAEEAECGDMDHLCCLTGTSRKRSG